MFGETWALVHSEVFQFSSLFTSGHSNFKIGNSLVSSGFNHPMWITFSFYITLSIFYLLFSVQCVSPLLFPCVCLCVSVYVDECVYVCLAGGPSLCSTLKSSFWCSFMAAGSCSERQVSSCTPRPLCCPQCVSSPLLTSSTTRHPPATPHTGPRPQKQGPRPQSDIQPVEKADDPDPGHS